MRKTSKAWPVNRIQTVTEECSHSCFLFFSARLLMTVTTSLIRGELQYATSFFACRCIANFKSREPISSTMQGGLKLYLLQKAAGSCLNAGFALAHQDKNNDILNICCSNSQIILLILQCIYTFIQALSVKPPYFPKKQKKKTLPVKMPHPKKEKFEFPTPWHNKRWSNAWDMRGKGMLK